MNEQETFVAVQKNHEGAIINFKTSTGRVLSYRKAMMEIENGLIADASVFRDETGECSIRITSSDRSMAELPLFF
ncbi:hypothetical protein GGR02_000074 [Anoxybacillus voinovskiensis]|uniref:DUF3892 domain-containing protein n=1 Tax=Anoxybacteroides voinovskiense TaxID=230470 RepID=A0A840DQL9_9BACL|nr:DUF3892 domain-containing protein [Anoxybacillus voinovskiensis]MBB4072328.1 hypothetical protein [Anoxybacillus voinovskiensis]GGJ58738.1 hypothetical protein GCM10008982_04820 [Anoxybacillus voinovskiensis]